MMHTRMISTRFSHKPGLTLPAVILCLLAVGFTTDSFAQGRRSKFSTELKSVGDVHLESGGLNEHAKACGLTAGDLEAPASAALASSRLRVIQTATDFIFITANVVTAGALCSAAVDVELFRWSRDFGASVSVWRHSAMLSGGKEGFDGRVRQKVDALTREFIADWQKARQ